MHYSLLPEMSTYSDIPNAARVASAPDH